MNEKKIISFDSQVLNTIQACAAKFNFQFQQNLQLPDKAEPLERGDLLHKLFEVYYGCIGKCARLDSDVYTFLDGNEVRTFDPTPMFGCSPLEIAKFSVDLATMHATKMQLGPGEVDETLYQFNEYVKHYCTDSWHPLAVEETGAKVLYEDDDIQMIYTFKIDMVAEQGNFVCAWDHKSSQRRSNPSSLSNQFTGYAWGLGMQHILVNKIGFQKTLKPSERFQRDILSYSKGQIDEWVRNSVWWGHMLNHFIENKTFPQNLTSCDKYSGCIYSRICESDPSLRENIVDRFYKIGETWDPTKHLEVTA
jgi:hypothetical protein